MFRPWRDNDPGDEQPKEPPSESVRMNTEFYTICTGIWSLEEAACLEDEAFNTLYEQGNGKEGSEASC